MVNISEPIKVWVLFADNKFSPHLFFWQNRKIKIDQVNLIHTSKFGSGIFYHFSVSAGSNFYQLRFDTQKLKWWLEATDTG